MHRLTNEPLSSCQKPGKSDILYLSKSPAEKSGREYALSSQLSLAAHGTLVVVIAVLLNSILGMLLYFARSMFCKKDGQEPEQTESVKEFVDTAAAAVADTDDNDSTSLHKSEHHSAYGAWHTVQQDV